MFDAINKQFNSAKRNAREEQFILESVMDVEEVLPGSEEDIDDIIDSDSVPEDVYKKVDAMLDKFVDSNDYDDTEVEELLDDDDDISEDEIDAVITEAIEGNLAEMDEGAKNPKPKEDPEDVDNIDECDKPSVKNENTIGFLRSIASSNKEEEWG